MNGANDNDGEGALVLSVRNPTESDLSAIKAATMSHWETASRANLRAGGLSEQEIDACIAVAREQAMASLDRTFADVKRWASDPTAPSSALH